LKKKIEFTLPAIRYAFLDLGDGKGRRRFNNGDCIFEDEYDAAPPDTRRTLDQCVERGEAKWIDPEAGTAPEPEDPIPTCDNGLDNLKAD